MQRRTSIELDDNTSEGDGDPELTNSAEGPDPVITQRRKSQALAKDVALHPTSQRPPKTADLLQASYQTWYARSEFARSIVTDMKKRQQRYAAPSASCLGVTLPPLANDSNRGGGKPSATESLLLPSAVAANASSPPAVSPAVSNTVAAVANPLAGCRSTLPRLPLMELSSARGARAVQSMTVSELLNADLGVVLTEGASGGPEGSRNP
ncbi:hypothetical protein DFJ73DRAFT_858912 [Zopfochytrium polystomum]|nr:hypothetical protein DFJ73DRAFT_858912 [Zopfochytrium polystomum]